MRSLFLALALTFVPPVDGPVERPFDPPARPWAPGHRGIDYRAAPGTPVRAVATGVVGFAGPVAGGLVVAVDHPGGLRSSYAYLARLDVAAGRAVEAGEVLGVSGGRGPGHGPGVVHLGLRRGGRYLDPASLVRPPLRARLAPVEGPLAPPVCPATLNGRPGSGREFTRPQPHR